MAKLLQREDGGYYTRVKTAPGLISTLQIGSEGIEYLFRQGVRPGMQISDSHRRILYNNRWLYTKGEQPGPGVCDKELCATPLAVFDETGITVVISEQAPLSHADRPMFLIDPPTNTHYTVLHLNGGNSCTEPIVMCIKYRAAQWLKAQGAEVGRELPAGVFNFLFLKSLDLPEAGMDPSRG